VQYPRSEFRPGRSDRERERERAEIGSDRSCVRVFALPRSCPRTRKTGPHETRNTSARKVGWRRLSAPRRKGEHRRAAGRRTAGGEGGGRGGREGSGGGLLIPRRSSPREKISLGERDADGGKEPPLVDVSRSSISAGSGVGQTKPREATRSRASLIIPGTGEGVGGRKGHFGAIGTAAIDVYASRRIPRMIYQLATLRVKMNGGLMI